MRYGRGRGGWFGRGFEGPFAYFAPYQSPERGPKAEVQVMRDRAEMLRAELELLNRRLSELDTEEAESDIT
jgi:hypothetical protein